MLFPDRFLEQVEPLQHPEAEASEVVEVAVPPEVEQLLLLQEEPELQQQEPLQEQRPEETLQRNRVKPKLQEILRIQLSPVELQRNREQRMVETMQRNRVKP